MLFLVSLIVSSKLFYDEAVYNEDFAQAVPMISLRRIAKAELARRDRNDELRAGKDLARRALSHQREAESSEDQRLAAFSTSDKLCHCACF